MVKDTKYIIKRIIIGVGIALVLMLIKGSLIMNVEAQEVNAIPNDILIATGSGVTSYSPSTNTWNGQTVYALPSNMSYDWGSGVSLYFRYPQNSGATYCDFASNKATLSGRLYNASTSSIGTPLVQFEDTTSGVYTRCSSQTTSNYVDFICNNINSSHGFNIQIGNAPNGRWGIVRQLNFECIQSGADITANINANNNQNTQNIINNNNQNTQNIINNQNENTQKEIDSNITCSSLNANENGKLNGYLSSNGTFNQSNDFKTTRYIPINDFSKIIVLEPIPQSFAYLCFYNGSPDKLISCTNTSISHENDIINVPTGATEVRFSLPIYQNDDFKANFKICRSSNLALSDSLSNDDISTASNDFDSFIRNMNPNTHGLSDIVTAPLRLVSALTSSTCSPLRIPLPFVDSDVVLPCMVPIYQQYFGQWFSLYQLITTGVIAYWVSINFFRIIKNILNPTDDKVEVYDL